jgi:hypothetical protein
MLHERAEQQPARVALLMARFLRAIEAQRRRDAELIAGLERLSCDPRVRRIIRGIVNEES